MHPSRSLAPARRPQIGVTGIATDQGNATSHPFARVGGRLPFLPADMPQARALRCRPRRRACCAGLPVLTPAGTRPPQPGFDALAS